MGELESCGGVAEIQYREVRRQRQAASKSRFSMYIHCTLYLVVELNLLLHVALVIVSLRDGVHDIWFAL